MPWQLGPKVSGGVASPQGIAAHHPGEVPGDVAPPGGGKAKHDEKGHRRAHHEPDTMEQRAVAHDRPIELGQPQPRERAEQEYLSLGAGQRCYRFSLGL